VQESILCSVCGR